jgi:hypothetical protein
LFCFSSDAAAAPDLPARRRPVFYLMTAQATRAPAPPIGWVV